MKTRTKTPLSRGRRQFLQQVAAGGGVVIAGAAVAGSMGRIEAPVEAAPAQQAPESKGYRETAHIRRYYETTRV